MKRKLDLIKYLTVFCSLIFLLAACSKFRPTETIIPFRAVKTLAGADDDRQKRFGEPFGAAFKNDVLYVSDGEQGKIRRVSRDGTTDLVTGNLNTPSAIAFDKDGFLLVADAGSHTIKRVNTDNGEVALVAGVENQSGFADGEASQALFNAPIGVAVSGDKIYVADTYNDKIRLVENGKVSTVAGSERGFADGENPFLTKFDTPCGVTILPDGSLLVADTGNRRLRRVEAGGKVSTFAGTGEADSTDGLFGETKFVEPVAVTVDKFGAIYVADGNSIRALNRRIFPFAETISDTRRGFSDGNLQNARFNRPSGLAFDERGNLFVADAENQVVRVFTGEDLGAEMTGEKIESLKFTPEEFRALQPARWTYNPPESRRDIAGTLGEIRGEIADGKNAWFHNGLDIAGSYGETARFVRTETVLRPLAVQNFSTARELIRMPTVGYIHIRLGRDQNDKLFGDRRFQFTFDENGKTKDLRIPRGTRFEAGESLGALNSLNHVHLVAGRTGAEMNALDALVFPNIADTIAPQIEKVFLFDENWREINETGNGAARIKLGGRARVVVRAFDRMDGNAGYRKLGVYRLGYQILKEDGAPATEPKWTISFAAMPDEDFVRLAYAPGSRSGYTPQTIFDYIVTNEVGGGRGRENFLETGGLENGKYILRVFAADFFGNQTSKETNVEIVN